MKLTYQEYDSLIQAIKYNKGKIFKTCVNEKVVNALILKGFCFKIKVGIQAKKEYISLYEIDGEEGFEKFLE